MAVIVMVGAKLREARLNQQMSLSDVAGMADVSAATLSRIERDKQAIDVGLFLTLARVLKTAPADLLAEDGDMHEDPLAMRIAAMQTRDRTKLWRQLNEERRAQRNHHRADSRTLSVEVDELLAHVDFLRDEIESVRSRLGRGR